MKKLPDAMKHGGGHVRDAWIEAALNAPGPRYVDPEKHPASAEPYTTIFLARGLADLAAKLPEIWPGKPSDPNRKFAIAMMDATLAEAAKRLLLPELQS